MPGERVRASFGRGRAIGIVAAHAAGSSLPRAQLKKIGTVIDTMPLWDETTFGLLLWAADYYHHPLGEVLFGAMPKALRKGGPARRDEIVWRLFGRRACGGRPRERDSAGDRSN